MGNLLHGWNEQFATSDTIDLLNLMGEEECFCAIEIGNYLLRSEPNVSHHGLELAKVLQFALAKVLQSRNARAERLREVLLHLSRSKEHEFEDFNSDDENDFDDDENDFDDFDSNEDELLLPPSMPGHESSVALSPGASVSNCSREQDQDSQEELTIISGCSDDEIRHAIYFRDEGDWDLPDLVSQLQEWNKGLPLSFTLEFEHYLGNRLFSKEEGEEKDD